LTYADLPISTHRARIAEKITLTVQVGNVDSEHHELTAVDVTFASHRSASVGAMVRRLWIQMAT
jgi:hypothetical protein